MLLDKYRDLESLAGKLGVRDFSLKEAGGKVQIAGKTTYALERDLLWDAIKKHAGWEGEVAADVKADRSDIHGIHTVQAGRVAVEDRQDPPRRRQSLHGHLQRQQGQAEGPEHDPAGPAAGDSEPLGVPDRAGPSRVRPGPPSPSFAATTARDALQVVAHRASANPAARTIACASAACPAPISITNVPPARRTSHFAPAIAAHHVEPIGAGKQRHLRLAPHLGRERRRDRRCGRRAGSTPPDRTSRLRRRCPAREQTTRAPRPTARRCHGRKPGQRARRRLPSPRVGRSGANVTARQPLPVPMSRMRGASRPAIAAGLLDQELGLGPRDEDAGADREPAAVELLHAADVRHRLPRRAPPGERRERRRRGRRGLVLAGQPGRAIPGQDMAQQQLGVEPGFGSGIPAAANRPAASAARSRRRIAGATSWRPTRWRRRRSSPA